MRGGEGDDQDHTCGALQHVVWRWLVGTPHRLTAMIRSNLPAAQDVLQRECATRVPLPPSMHHALADGDCCGDTGRASPLPSNTHAPLSIHPPPTHPQFIHRW
jgi:hypothetical protein